MGLAPNVYSPLQPVNQGDRPTDSWIALRCDIPAVTVLSLTLRQQSSSAGALLGAGVGPGRADEARAVSDAAAGASPRAPELVHHLLVVVRHQRRVGSGNLDANSIENILAQ